LTTERGFLTAIRASDLTFRNLHVAYGQEAPAKEKGAMDRGIAALTFLFNAPALLRRGMVLALLATLAACAAPVPPTPPEVAGYGTVEDGGFVIDAVPESYVPAQNRKAQVPYAGIERPGTIVVDPFAKVLYLVEDGGTAMRYRVAVGREGRAMRGGSYVGRKAEWPYWTPTANMIRTQPEFYADKAGGMAPGPKNPLGARALYLYRGGRDTMFRIHGTGDYTSIGHATSAGCIRLYNQDIIDLYERVPTGSTVKVRTQAESLEIEGPQPEEPIIQDE
jgi:lipoprotein-anchoring transpeptidase ErfK/SrfK